MTIWQHEARLPTQPSFAGGVAGLGDIAAATRDSLINVENANSSFAALQRAIDERRKAIHAATGAQLPDPLAEAEAEWRRAQTERPGERTDRLADAYDRHLTTFRSSLAGLAEKFPDHAETIGAGRDPWDDAARLAREADERLGRLMESRGGLAKYGAMLAGGMLGALNDPMTIASLTIGGGPGTARSAAGRILQVAGREAVINAAVEAAIQPSVQAWRERAGLPAGFDEAVRNVMFAGALGGAFGGAIGAAGEGLARLVRPADTARGAEAALAREDFPQGLRDALSADAGRSAPVLAPLREALPAAARGALDAIELDRATAAQRPADASPRAHDAATGAADRAMANPDLAEAWPGFRPDPDQVARVARAIAGPAETAAAPAERGLAGFLIDRGGVADHGGELAAIGATGVTERFRGRLVRPDGESLDYAREAAAQAGYFDRLYGDPATASQRSTVADLLSLLEEDLRGNRVTPSGAGLADDGAAARAHLEGLIDEIARHGGPALPDATLERAARMALDDGLDPFDALERVLVSEDAPAAAVARTGEVAPGWSDAELLAASERRGPEPTPDAPGTMAEPGRLVPEDTDLAELAVLADDFMLPWDDGQMVSAAALRERLERDETLARVVEACRA